MDRTTSELEFHQMFERITDAYVALDRDWRYIYLNAKACEFFGRRVEDLIGRHIWTEFPEGEGQPFHRAYEQAMADQQPRQIEAWYPPYQRWFENRIYPSAEGLTIYFLDITERKRAEQELLQHQRMLSQAQKVAHVGSWEWDIAENRVTWSEELYRIYGMTPAQHAATFESYLALVHPQDRERVQQTIAQAVTGTQPFEFEERIVRPDGAVRTLLSRGMVEVDAAGRAVRLMGACQDISERKRAEQLEAGQHEILAGIAAQRPLAQSLAQIAHLHEAMNPGALCSLLLLDESGQHVLHGAAPSLPEAYSRALHGLEIGEARGSCGTAAWRRERVVVADIASHPYWANYKSLALAHGLKACWSTPVLGSGGKVLGTFAVYFRELREPRPEELYSIDRMLPLTGVAIESEQLIRRLRERDRFFEMSLEIFCIIDPAKQRLVQFNPSLPRVTGYSADELKSRSYREFLRVESDVFDVDPMQQLDAAGQRMHDFVSRCICRDGSERQLEWVSFVAPDGLVYAVARDITERRRVEAELAYASSHDPVTGLQHHLLLEHALAEILCYPNVPASVLVVGLDRFQLVNASVGHPTGDDVLLRLATRLQTALGGRGRIARFAGDEFMVTVAGMPPAAVLELAEVLRAVVAEPIEGEDYRLLLTASVGVSHSSAHGTDARNLLRRAEAAMSQAKQEGRDRVCEFSLAQMQELEDRLLLGNHLRDAIRLDELELHYQPQHAAADLRLTGFEALLRWNCRQLGQVSPARFIPIAEALGLMHEIGGWVLDVACRQVREWLDLGYRDFTVAVNVSAQQLQRPGLLAQVAASLQRHAVPPAMLDVEITESSLMENVGRVQRTLAELKALGIKLSLDDFGTGYSSLAYLKQFPIDKLKIDQIFVRDLPQDAADAAIVRTIIAVAHELHMGVAAEGVATAEQAQFLVGAGCDELQGHHLGHALSASDAARRLDAARG
ncbi:Response regulator receiver modulated diguanylate cyclase/phosphodiesterase with PAS/PAC sensor(S) [Rhodanobacter sp. Root179]|uniref:sensor domain-containing protein n=1 Tax=Rhodanobacter sp. Root179 TaxID=1736482 RepID=UPI0006F92F67|nr:EAL domain-containing protein [Rhodanobacter sp. Root179]KRB43993.1 diguanylate cyclase [Rhodanobacter sp. Root179]